MLSIVADPQTLHFTGEDIYTPLSPEAPQENQSPMTLDEESQPLKEYEALNQLASQFVAQGNTDGAVQCWDRMASLATEPQLIFKIRDNILTFLGQRQGQNNQDLIIDQWRKLDQQFPGNVTIQWSLAYYLKDKNTPEARNEAIKLFTNIVQQNVANVDLKREALVLLANLYAQINDLSNAIMCGTAALQLKTPNIFNQGWSHLRLGEFYQRRNEDRDLIYAGMHYVQVLALGIPEENPLMERIKVGMEALLKKLSQDQLVDLQKDCPQLKAFVEKK